MTMPIAVLDQHVVNQIAAGEVIERPASVVKELVENSLDAGAKHVQVTVEDGGVGLIRVTDDGSGISPEELPLAFARHATSKLRGIEDLWGIRSLGFRGEALASIAAVARVTLTSRPSGFEFGHRIRAEAGVLSEVAECGAPGGTTVEVRDLFFNTPARRKFLRSCAAEGARIASVLTGLALVRPDVAFQLVNERRTVLTTPGDGDLREALCEFLGGVAEEALRPVSFTHNGISVTGYVGSRTLSWASRGWELVAVNGRLVESRLVQAAVEKAYAGFLPLRRYPVAVIHLDVDPGRVDVNVHPAKREVRFRQEGEVFRAVCGAVESALHEEPLFRAVSPGGRVDTPYGISQPGDAVRELQFTWDSGGGEGEETPGSRDAFSEPAQGRSPLRYLGQVAATYLVAEDDTGLVVVDQHAAHERVVYDALQAGLATGSSLPVQTLLWSTRVELTPVEAELLDRVLPVLSALGFELEPFGGRSLLVRAVPVLLSRLDLREALSDAALAEAQPGEGRSSSAQHERLFRSMACRAAVKAKQPLSPAEAEALLEQWQSSAQPWTCPHGRPAALRWPLGEIAASFLRR